MWLYHEISLNSWEKDLLHYTSPPKQEIPAALMKFYFLETNFSFTSPVVVVVYMSLTRPRRLQNSVDDRHFVLNPPTLKICLSSVIICA